jgi:hypothetical protein
MNTDYAWLGSHVHHKVSNVMEGNGSDTEALLQQQLQSSSFHKHNSSLLLAMRYTSQTIHIRAISHKKDKRKWSLKKKDGIHSHIQTTKSHTVTIQQDKWPKTVQNSTAFQHFWMKKFASLCVCPSACNNSRNRIWYWGGVY